MKKIIVTIFVLAFWLLFRATSVAATINSSPWWSIQSIDTMKYSRDLTAAKLGDPSFDKVIDFQVKTIADTGATHVAIATPYDQEFVPMLTRWVAAARKYNLNVWFRGNFSGWEGWFNYSKITPDEHKKLLGQFIANNSELFADGDLFSPCPECENGAMGDPRQTGDIAGYRKFLIAEYTISKTTFSEIHKNVQANLNSMNFDVANVIMDKKTTAALGNLVVIDHYVDTPQTLVKNIRSLASQSGGKIFLGEFGVPIPDINGDMTENDQAVWLDQAGGLLLKEPEVVGMNYWTSFGGSTKLWNDDGTPRKGQSVLVKYFKPKTVSGKIIDQFGNGISNVKVSMGSKTQNSNSDGTFSLPYVDPNQELILTVSQTNTNPQNYRVGDQKSGLEITIQRQNVTIFETILGFLTHLLKLR